MSTPPRSSGCSTTAIPRRSEVLVYDWIPWRRQRRVIKRLIDAPIDVRTGTPERNM